MSVISFPLNRFLAAIAPPVAAIVLVTPANPCRRSVPFRGTKRNRITGGRRAHTRPVYDRFNHFSPDQYDQRTFCRKLTAPSTNCFIASGIFFLEEITYAVHLSKKIKTALRALSVPYRTGGGGLFPIARANYPRVKRTLGGKTIDTNAENRFPRSPQRDRRWRALLLIRVLFLGSRQIGQKNPKPPDLESTPIPPRSPRGFASDRP